MESDSVYLLLLLLEKLKSISSMSQSDTKCNSVAYIESGGMDRDCISVWYQTAKKIVSFCFQHIPGKDGNVCGSGLIIYS
mgnify:CR=1 FL=1